MKHRNSQFSTLNYQLFARRTACGLLAAGMCIMAALLCLAAEDDVIAVTERADGSTNFWTRADAMDALGLINRKYWRDMESESGRRDWHGKCTTSINEELEIRVWTYEDGFAWTNKWTRPKSAIERAREVAERRAAAEAQKAEGKPSKIAENYRRRAAAITNDAPEVVEREITGN